MNDRRFTCLGCGKLSPDTDEETTLISSKYGWRIMRRITPEGEAQVEARCPTCWVRFRASEPPRAAGSRRG